MALLDFQTALGRLVRRPGANASSGAVDLSAEEMQSLAKLARTSGFRFTLDVQRSWCRGRAARGARMTLSILPVELREGLLDDWVASGGGTSSFFAQEADAFLEFLARRLPEPSHAQTVCRFEQATLRVNEAAAHFSVPDVHRLAADGSMLRTGRGAALVPFHAEPRLLLSALAGEGKVPPLAPHSVDMLFAPGFDGWWRAASREERVLWERLSVPTRMDVLRREEHRHELIEDLFAAGALELAASTA